MARERWRYNHETGATDCVDSFGEPIPDKDISKLYTLTVRSAGVIPDLEPYRSPIDMSVINSRSEHRDHMKRHGVIELGNEKVGPNTPPQRPPVRDSIQKAAAMVSNGYRSQMTRNRGQSDI